MGDDGATRRITPEELKRLCKEQRLFSTASLNEKLYLHYRGYSRIEGLGAWTGLRALWLEGNGFGAIEGLEAQQDLRCLYLHQNCIKRIEHLDCCPKLATLQLSDNMITSLSNLSGLSRLSTLQLAHNKLESADDLRHLLMCPSISVLDLQNNLLDDPAVVDILEGLPQLAVLQLQGNPVVTKIKDYRRTLISRCKSLTYLDDRPVFAEERLAVEAWSIGGLPAERAERRRQREEKEDAHRRNLQYMKELATRALPLATSAAIAPPSAAQSPALAPAVDSEVSYERALHALEARRKQLLAAGC
mmetsp:Transcript_38234/g.114221  ORF Transcript_38234/g.114221 Transcript_38234/m.114221 type:complete len:303 (+) Transcript_38234:60-968(+)